MSIHSTPAVARVYSDGGRSAVDKAYNDTNACTVNALANCTGWDYALCHDIAAMSGRWNGKGHNPVQLLKLAGRFGAKNRKLTRITYSNPWTLQKFIKKNPTGNFYVCTSHHAFSIVDGVVKDWLHNGDMCRLVQVWRITGTVYNGRKPKRPVVTKKPRKPREKRVEYTVRLRDKEGDAYDVWYYEDRAEAIKEAREFPLDDVTWAVDVESVSIGGCNWKIIYSKSRKS
jgi:hypothetical protein